jgi:excisionase family DNA binding protein
VLVALASPLFCAGEYGVWIFACQEFYYAIVTIFDSGILFPVKIISTQEAAKRLGVTDSRVRKMILTKRLKAIKVGREWLIDPKDLEAVKDRKVGRPRKARKSTKR